MGDTSMPRDLIFRCLKAKSSITGHGVTAYPYSLLPLKHPKQAGTSAVGLVDDDILVPFRSQVIGVEGTHGAVVAEKQVTAAGG